MCNGGKIFWKNLNVLWPLESLSGLPPVIPKHPSVCGDGEEEGTELQMHIEQVDNMHSLSTKIGSLRLQEYVVTGF